MQPTYLLDHILPAASALLPPRLTSPQATALLLAIGFQESGFLVRRQAGGGPARGLWQFEQAGIHGVLTHPRTRPLVETALLALAYPLPTTSLNCWRAIEHNDILATVFARLLLYTVPRPLPTRQDPDEGWQQYLAAWRPGRPRPETWLDHYARAWLVPAWIADHKTDVQGHPMDGPD
jgi:hypothetical protein